MQARHVVMRCLSVRPSVCLSRWWILSKRINISSIFFSPSDSLTTLVCPHQTVWLEPPNGSVECRCAQIGRQKSRFWAYIWLHCVLLTLRSARCYQHSTTGPRSRELWHLSLVVSGRVCWWRQTTTKCMTRSLNVTQLN